MVTTEELEVVRHVVHKILIPCIFAIGLVGNTLSIIVLTRKRMRCSTNIYLTGLAITDLLYLAMCFIMSLKHYKGIHTYKMYWSLMGLFHWLIDSFSYISICIVVSFTIERYIAVCHPIRGQSLCTEARAKKVIGIISIVVMLSILSTAFEYQLRHDKGYVDKFTGEGCLLNSNSTEIPLKVHDAFHKTKPTAMVHTNRTADDIVLLAGNNDSSMLEGHPNVTFEKHDNVTNNTITSNCTVVNFYSYEASSLSNNPNYSIFYITTSILYAGIPLVLLVTFNTFLILAVRKSNRLRKDMTNNINSRQVKQKLSSMTQENKITITLIAVVILFIVCQLPWACISIAENFTELDDNFEKLISNIANLMVAINAAANFFLYCLLSDKYRRTVKELVTGHHYRRQGTLSNSLSRQTTLGSSWYKHSLGQGSFSDKQREKSSIKGSPQYFEDQRQSPTIRPPSKIEISRNRKQSTIQEEIEPQLSLNLNHNNNNNNNTNLQPKGLASLRNIPKSSPALINNREHHHIQPLHFESISKSSNQLQGNPHSPPYTVGKGEILRNRPSSFGPFDCNPVQNSWKQGDGTLAGVTSPEENHSKFCEQFLKPSSSSHSLTRSQSLDASTPKIRHSPDCKDFPYNF